MPRETPIRHAVLVALVISTGGLSACRSGPTRAEVEGPRYPASPDRRPPLDVQVFMLRSQKEITLTNTTARRFGPSRLWLNGWFHNDIDGLDIGETLRLPMESFRDVFGDQMRGGGFFATQAPERIVLAELETSEGLHRLVYVERREN